MWEIIGHKWRKYVATGIAIAVCYSWIAEEVYPEAGLLTMQDLILTWNWWVWVLIGMVLLWVATLVFTNQQRRLLESHDNWIVAYKARYGKLPQLPNSLLQAVDNYTAGEAISKKMTVRRISMQYWHGLTDDNRNRLLQLIDWLGLDHIEYLQEMKDGAPPGGKPISKRSSFRF